MPYKSKPHTAASYRSGSQKVGRHSKTVSPSFKSTPSMGKRSKGRKTKGYGY